MDIPDAAVEAAAKADYERWRHPNAPAWEDADEGVVRQRWRDTESVPLAAAAPYIAAQVLRDALARLGRAAYAVDSTHHFHGIQCSCGFTGDARKRTQTEHITTAMLEAYDHD